MVEWVGLGGLIDKGSSVLFLIEGAHKHELLVPVVKE